MQDIQTQTLTHGYGITCRADAHSQAKIVSIANNIIKDCKRKAVDLHGGEKVNIVNNLLKNCMVAGIYAYTYIVENLVHDINIVGNQIIECSYANNKLGALCVGALTDTQDETILEKNVNVTNNLFENCGGETNGIIFI